MLKSKKIKLILLFLIVALAAGLAFNWEKFSALAQSVIDSFSDTARVADSWNVTVDTANGEVKLAEKTCDNGTWFCAESALCTNTLGDGAGILVKRVNEATTKQWKTTQTNCDLPQCAQDGQQSTDNLVADNTVNFALYPARDACKAAGGRLPTKEELQCLYANRATFGDNFGTSYYWSGTEYSTTNAWYVHFSSGYTNGNLKTSSNSVRCVQGW